MRLTAFRITNFRSIVDSDWVPFSPDGITVLVGQNESGKSSVLEALCLALAGDPVTPDDFRIDADLPQVLFRVDIEPNEVSSYFKALTHYQRKALEEYLATSRSSIELTCRSGYEMSQGKKLLTWLPEVTDARLREMAAQMRQASTPQDEESPVPESTPPVTSEESSPQSATTEAPPLTSSSSIASNSEPDIALELWRALPLGVLFNEESGRLPSQVDIDDKGQPVGPGAKAADNFLRIADINLPELLKCDRRSRENTLNRANSRVSANFNSFWTQTIGKSGRLALKCDIDNYAFGTSEKAGRPHLVFWICDGNTQLYPKQRSQGVRWFVSFYLQLKATEKARTPRVFLLDEPGANLHSKAQGDVLKLINQLGKDTSTVIYATHSPQMLEYPKLFRVRAVQRDGSLDESPTTIIDAHRLGTASTDTLSPILAAMGADLSQHQVIRKTNNVLLEEMSGYYYLSSFWKMWAIPIEAHFIAATGVNKIEALANMFRGWGLDFIVAVDDDKQGREAYKSMKRELFGDVEELASKKLLKLPGCAAIEDALSKADFAKFVLSDEKATINGTNAEYVKSTAKSKPVLAFKFAMSVDQGDVNINSLSSESRERISTIVEALCVRLT